MILDRQGRLFGRLSLLDLVGLFLLLCLGWALRYGIQASRYGALQVVSIEPKKIAAGPGNHLKIKGTGLDRTVTARIGDYPDWGVFVIDGGTVGVEIPEEVTPGFYRVIVRDSRGRNATVPDAVEVVWVPQVRAVRPKLIYPTGAQGTRIEVRGRFFSSPCSVWVGDSELDVISVQPNQVAAHKKDGTPPLPLGPQPVTVVGAEGRTSRLEQGVTVIPAPEVVSVEPRALALGDTGVLLIRGRHLRDGTTAILDPSGPSGKGSLISPDCLRVEVSARPEQLTSGWKDLVLHPEGGPRLVAIHAAVNLEDSVRLLLIVDVLLDEEGAKFLPELEALPEWRLRRVAAPQKGQRPRVQILVPARMKVEPSFRPLAFGKNVQYLYEGKPLRKADSIAVPVRGRMLTGILAEEPHAVFVDERRSY